LDGKELYSKEEISSYFPSLEPMLMRNGEDLAYLEELKMEFIRRCKLHIKTMSTFDEYKK